MVTAIGGNHHRIVSQANVALPLCLIPTGGGRRRPALGRTQANVALPLCLTPTGSGRLRPALGRSGAGISAPENELQNREIGAFLDLVTERGRKLQ